MDMIVIGQRTTNEQYITLIILFIFIIYTYIIYMYDLQIKYILRVDKSSSSAVYMVCNYIMNCNEEELIPIDSLYLHVLLKFLKIINLDLHI